MSIMLMKKAFRLSDPAPDTAMAGEAGTKTIELRTDGGGLGTVRRGVVSGCKRTFMETSTIVIAIGRTSDEHVP